MSGRPPPSRRCSRGADRWRHDRNDPPTPATPAPWPPRRPAPTDGPDPTGTSRRTTQRETSAGDGSPRTSAPRRDRPDGHTAPWRPATADSDPKSPARTHSFPSPAKTRAPLHPGLLSTLLAGQHWSLRDVEPYE